MSFANLPQQNYDSFTPRAKDYMQQTIDRSKQAAEQTRSFFDMPYGPDPRQQLDIYCPLAEGGTNLPVVMFLHGGGWSFGYKEQMGFMATPIVAMPAIFVSVSYRLIPAHRFPAALDDTIAAIKWVHDNIAGYGGDPGRIGIGGHSAGGHLSAMAVLRRDLLEAEGLPEDVIKICLPVSATFRFEIGQLEAMGKDMLNSPEEAPSASPITFADGTRTPFFITWGSDDFDRVRNTSLDMVAKLESLGSSVGHHEFEGYDHYDTNLDLANPDNIWVKTVSKALAP
jgi:acetyl esterase/lipase